MPQILLSADHIGEKSGVGGLSSRKSTDEMGDDNLSSQILALEKIAEKIRYELKALNT